MPIIFYYKSIYDFSHFADVCFSIVHYAIKQKHIFNAVIKDIMLWFFYLLFPTHFPHILFACSCLMLIISCLHSYFLPSTDFLSFHALPYWFYIASCTVHLLMHSPAQSCTVCLLMCSLLRHSLVIQYIRTG